MPTVVVIDRKTARQLIPDSAQEMLMAAGNDLASNSWKVGDIANELVAELRERTSTAVIDAAMAIFVMVSADRIADMRTVAGFYPADIRLKYSVCSFSHFRAAKSAGKLESAAAWLQACVDTADEYGGVIMPVDKLRALMSQAGDNQDMPVYMKRLRTIYRTAQMLMGQKDSEVPDMAIEVARDVVARVEMLIGFDTFNDLFK